MIIQQNTNQSKLYYTNLTANNSTATHRKI